MSINRTQSVLRELAKLLGDVIAESDGIAAAESGDAESQVQLGYLYEFGNPTTSPDYSKAIYWFRQAAEHNHPAAFLHLGMMFFLGLGVEQNDLKSLILIEKAIDLDNRDAILWRARVIRGMTPDEYATIASQIAADHIH